MHVAGGDDALVIHHCEQIKFARETTVFILDDMYSNMSAIFHKEVVGSKDILVQGGIARL